jgi:hypothetical protein
VSFTLFGSARLSVASATSRAAHGFFMYLPQQKFPTHGADTIEKNGAQRPKSLTSRAQIIFFNNKNFKSFLL